MLRIASPLFLAAVAATAGSARAQDDFKQRPPEPPPAQPAPAAPTLTKPPKLKAEVPPTYPPEALAAGLSADVTMQIDIDAEGKVTAVTVTKGAGNGFDEAAQEAARRMEFEPAEIDGKPGAIRIEYTMRFRPAVPAPAAPAVAAEPEPPPPPPPPPARLIARGRAREKGTRDPVASASVSVTALDPAANPGLRETFGSTDDEGRFVLETSAPPGTKLRMVLSSGEHDPCIRDIEVPADSAQPLELTCIVAPYRGGRYETVVAAPRAGDDATRHTISQPEMTTVPGTFGDPLRVLQNLPGVARSPYGLGLLIIRGSSPQDSGVYIDGHRVPLLYHFLGGPSILTPDLLDRIDFYPGGFGVRYGRATAGVVDVTTRTEPVRRVHGSADVDFIDSSAYVEGPLGGNASGGLAARRSYIDTLLPFFIPEREGSTAVVVTPVYYDYQARITGNVGRGRLRLFVFGSEDSLKVIAQDPNQGDLDLGTAIGLHRVIGTWAVSAGKWTSVLSPSYGYDHVSFGAGEVGAKGWAHVLGLREDVTRTIGTKLKLAFGLDGEFRFDSFSLNAPLPPERRTYGRTMPAPQSLARTLANFGAAAYTELLWDPHPTVRLAPGIRFDYFHYSAVDLTSFDPRIVVRWARTPTQTFKVGAGIFHQNPQPNELDPQFGNPNLKLLWADQYHAGIEQGITRALSLEASLYYLRRHNLPIASARVGADGRLEGYTSEGYGRGYGLELRLRHDVTENFYGWISYTVARSEAVLSLQDAPTEPVPEYRPTMFDQTHNLILVASRRFGAYELGTRFRLVSGTPETPLSEGIYDADFNRHDPRRGAPGSVRRQLFHQLDVRAERTFTFDAWRFAIYLDVQNVYNAENPEATIHDYRYRNQAPVRGLPILPVLGVRGRF